MKINFNKLDKLSRYKIISNLIVPRPIAWISTFSNNNSINLAPFSYFTPLSSEPPTLIVSIGHKKDSSQKDTLKNLRERKRASIVISTPQQTKALNATGASLEYGESEFDKFKIESETINRDYPPTPKDSKIIFFCQYLKEVELEGSKTVPVILEIDEVFIADNLIDKENLKSSFTDVVARVGNSYYKLGDEIDIEN
jgi:flavin reductase (DIM6/NTAB) family NADH-FMN oxidoreductase RutF